MANLYLAERPIDDLSLEHNEFVHADVQQAMVNNAIRCYRSRFQQIINHVPRVAEWKVAGATYAMVTDPFIHVFSPWATKINIAVCLFDDGDPTARFKFRYVTGDDNTGKSVEIPSADGDWDGAGYYSGQTVLSLAGAKANFFEQLELEIRLYCKNACTVLSLYAAEDHA
jgi:hypothetical protein